MEELEQKKGYLKKNYILFLTNLEDEIIFKGGRICKAQNPDFGFSIRNQSKVTLMNNYT
jgi:hypothetical protein